MVIRMTMCHDHAGKGLALSFGIGRHGQLKRKIGGISQKMLTQTLRALERDGIVKRRVYPVIPPRVEYRLTPLGRTLLDPLKAICRWSETHLPQVHAARELASARASSHGHA